MQCCNKLKKGEEVEVVVDPADIQDIIEIVVKPEKQVS